MEAEELGTTPRTEFLSSRTDGRHGRSQRNEKYRHSRSQIQVKYNILKTKLVIGSHPVIIIFFGNYQNLGFGIEFLMMMLVRQLGEAPES